MLKQCSHIVVVHLVLQSSLRCRGIQSIASVFDLTLFVYMMANIFILQWLKSSSHKQKQHIPELFRCDGKGLRHNTSAHKSFQVCNFWAKAQDFSQFLTTFCSLSWNPSWKSTNFENLVQELIITLENILECIPKPDKNNNNVWNSFISENIFKKSSLKKQSKAINLSFKIFCFFSDRFYTYPHNRSNTYTHLNTLTNLPVNQLSPLVSFLGGHLGCQHK